MARCDVHILLHLFLFLRDISVSTRMFALLVYACACGYTSEVGY